MNNLNKILDKDYLSIKDVITCLNISEKTVFNWITDGVKVQLKGRVHEFSEPVKLKTTKIPSTLMFYKKDLIKFLKETNKSEKILDIPAFMRSTK